VPVTVLPSFRTDFYVRASFVDESKINNSAQTLLGALVRSGQFKDLKLSKMNASGKVWHEIQGKIAVPEGFRGFYVIVRKRSHEDPFNVFMRLDRQSEAPTLEEAGEKSLKWVRSVIETVQASIALTDVRIKRPEENISVKT